MGWKENLLEECEADYDNHIHDCGECDDEELCPEGERLLNRINGYYGDY